MAGLANAGAAAQDAEVRDPKAISDFRLDQPAGPTDPERPVTTTPRTVAEPTQAQPQPQATQPQAETPRATPPRVAPTPTQRVAPATSTREAAKPATIPAQQPTAATVLGDDPVEPEAQTDTIAPTQDIGVVPDSAPAPAEPTLEPTAAAPAAGPDWGTIAPYAVGALLLLALFWFTQRKRKTAALAAPIEANATPKVQAAPAAAPQPRPAPAVHDAPKPRPSGTVGIPIAKAPMASPPPAPNPQASPQPTPQPSLAERGYITTRAHQPEAPAPRPSGTIGIPASRIAATSPTPEPVIQLSEGTRLIASLSAEELIRDDDELRLRFALTIGNTGTIEARDVALRTVLLTAAPDSERAVAGWLANPTGDAATTIETINSGMQTQVTVNIRLSADRISAVRHGGEAVFVPMLAIALDYIGADGLDRSGDAFIIGQTGPKAANGIAAPVLPLPHEGALPRRWTDLAQRPTGLGTLTKG